jgi:hypothetical protein
MCDLAFNTNYTSLRASSFNPLTQQEEVLDVP